MFLDVPVNPLCLFARKQNFSGERQPWSQRVGATRRKLVLARKSGAGTPAGFFFAPDRRTFIIVWLSLVYIVIIIHDDIIIIIFRFQRMGMVRFARFPAETTRSASMLLSFHASSARIRAT